MREYSLSLLSDAVLLHDLAEIVRRDRLTTATLLAHIAEVDTRKLHVPLGYPSMHAYCVGALGLSGESALRRIQAARAARRFPALFVAVAEGRLHLTAVGLLAPHLTPENVDELVAAATNRSKVEIEILLARRGAPKAQPLATVSVTSVECVTQHSLANVESANSAQFGTEETPVGGSPESPMTVVPERYVVRITVDRGTHERLRYAQALLSHAVPTGDLGQVFDRALVALIAQIERRKFGAARRTAQRNRAARSRHIPASIRKAVWDRDGGQCTFVGTEGHRCDSRKFLEVDHVEPYARTPEASVDGLRLRCRAHNQFEAEQVFGTEFMKRKRDQARAAAEENQRAKARQENAPEGRAAAVGAAVTTGPDPEVEEQIRDVLAALRGLGLKGEQARRAADHARTLGDATLVDRIRAALQFHGECVMQNPRVNRLLRASG